VSVVAWCRVDIRRHCVWRLPVLPGFKEFKDYEGF